MLYLVTYDVSSEDNAVREKIAHALAAAGLVRVQYSVFWGFLSRNEAESVALKVQQILGTAEGDVRVVPICKKCRTRLLQVTVKAGGGSATIARGIATINTQHLSRPAKELLGKGTPATSIPAALAGNAPTRSPVPTSADARGTLSVPPGEDFDIDVLTAKKRVTLTSAAKKEDFCSTDIPQVPLLPVLNSQAAQSKTSTQNPPHADPNKKPFLLI